MFALVLSLAQARSGRVDLKSALAILAGTDTRHRSERWWWAWPFRAPDAAADACISRCRSQGDHCTAASVSLWAYRNKRSRLRGWHPPGAPARDRVRAVSGRR